MVVVTYKEPALINAVEQYISRHTFYNDMSKVVNDSFPNNEVFYWGGIVRNALVDFIYERDIISKDVDFLVNDYRGDYFDMTKLSHNFGAGVRTSRFGTPKIKLSEDYEMDIVPFSRKRPYFLDVPRRNNLTIADILRSCDMTTGALAFSPSKREIYSCDGLSSILRSEVELLFGDEFPAVMMTRLALHSRKLDFKLGPKAISFISKTYDPSQDTEIYNYLLYKKSVDDFDYVRSFLNFVKINNLSTTDSFSLHEIN